MTRETKEFVSRCSVCQQVKYEHQTLVGLLQHLEILEWKWEHISIDFMVGFPRLKKKKHRRQ